MNRFISFAILISFAIFYLLPSNLITNLKSISPISLLSSVFFSPSTTSEQLAEKYRLSNLYRDRNIKILVIPGHDDDSPGATYKNLIEKDVNLSLAKELVSALINDRYFDVTLARDENGYNKQLIPKLTNTDDTKIFVTKQKALMDSLIASGQIKETTGIYHGLALPETATKLYSINQWANENNFDLIINIHFNDYPGHRFNKPGKYNGFAIYVPEKQYSNSEPSIEIGKHIKSNLEKYFPVSNHPQEQMGVIEDQSLIAIGSRNTLDSAVVLIECDYLYAGSLQSTQIRQIALKKYAQETYNGIKEYFEEKSGNNTSILQENKISHLFTNDMSRTNTQSAEYYYLQLALAKEGSFPPTGYSKNECSISGKFGECTEMAVKEFQLKNKIPSTGLVDFATRSLLNNISKEL